jgi:hypothetical protein
MLSRICEQETALTLALSQDGDDRGEALGLGGRERHVSTRGADWMPERRQKGAPDRPGQRTRVLAPARSAAYSSADDAREW